jgi:hypothetical protein
MGRINKISHTPKEQFPQEFHEFYHDKPKNLSLFPKEINETCLMVPTGVIDSNGSVFCDSKKRKVDEIYHCNKLGLIENKAGNYGSTQLQEKFGDHKNFIEKKYHKFACCKIGYCVLKAERLSQKLKREFRVTPNRELYYFTHPDKKKFKIDQCQVYFVKRR